MTHCVGVNRLRARRRSLLPRPHGLVLSPRDRGLRSGPGPQRLAGGVGVPVVTGPGGTAAQLRVQLEAQPAWAIGRAARTAVGDLAAVPGGGTTSPAFWFPL